MSLTHLEEKMILFTILFFGCGDDKESEIPEITTDGTATTCSGTAPVIQEIICENTGLVVENDSQENLPTFTLNVATTDDDGDLTSYTMLIEFDAQIDDVLSEDAVDLDVSGTISEDSCNVSEADIGTRIFIKGGQPALETTYEWYVTVFDAAGMRSETEMVVCTTPNAQGESVD